jgi:peroxin-16
MLIQFTEVFIEMAIQKRLGVKAKWRFILTAECIKAGIRLAMLHYADRRMLLSPVVPEREHDSPSTTNPSPIGSPMASPSMDRKELEQVTAAASWEGSRTGRRHWSVSAVKDESDVSQYLMSKVLTSAKKDPLSALRSLDGEWLLTELMFILRPVIYGMS